MQSGRKSQKRCASNAKVTNFAFDMLFTFSTNAIANPYLLLALDILQIVTLPYFYINPIYSHLTKQELFQIYFESVHPMLYFDSQNAAIDSYPVCLTVFSVCLVGLFGFGKCVPLIVMMAGSFVLALIPFFIVRIASQIVNIAVYLVYIKIMACLFLVLTLAAMAMVLLKYDKLIKITDFLLAILLFANINQFALIGLLAMKIAITFALGPKLYAKQLKLSLQLPLWFCNFLLIFVNPSPLNYVIMAVLIVASLTYASFLIFLRYQHQDIAQLEEEQLQSLTQKYSSTEIHYFKNINAHILQCNNVACNCREVLNIHGPKDLRIWAKTFNKNSLQLAANEIDKANPKYFQAQTNYIKVCLQKEQPDFEGFVRVNELVVTNIVQAYYKYHYSKQYKHYLQKTAPKIINMNAIDQNDGVSPYQDLLDLENNVCFLIQRLKLFWEQLLNSQDYRMLSSLIEQISQKVTKVKQSYSSIEQRYDEKEQAQYYYNIFKLLLLHERPGEAITNHHKASYILVSICDRIVNITTSITHLFEASRSKILGKKYTSFMLLAYANDHQTWKKQFLSTYKPDGESSFLKAISVSPSQIKVVRMTHTLLPQFDLLSEEQPQNTDEIGVTIVTLIQHHLTQQFEQLKEQKDIFHLLVCRNSLDIIAYESTIFQYFQTKANVGNANKILRANLIQVFPNLNKEALLRTNKSQHKLIARPNKQFFKLSSQQSQSETPLIKIFEHTNKSQNYESQLLVNQLPSHKNQQLGLLLLKFEVIIQNQDSQTQKQTSNDLQLDEVKKKTLKKIVQSACEDREKPKSSITIQKYLNILIWISFTLVFALNSLSLILFHCTYSNINSEMLKYDFQTQFYLDFEYTKAYYLEFQFGQNRIKEMEMFWNFNFNYPDVVTVFKQIEKKIFKQKFNSYLNQFQISSSFAKLEESIKSIENQMKYLKKILFIIFFCCLGLIIINFAISLYHYFKSQSDLENILQGFLSLDHDQIRNNLKKIEGLQSFLQLYDFQQIIEEQVQQKYENTCSFLAKSNISGHKNSQLLKQSRSKRLKLKNKIEEKQLFQSMIQKYFQNIGVRKQHDLSSIAKVTKNQKSNLIVKKVPSISCNQSQIKKNKSRMSKLNDATVQENEKNSSSLNHGFSKNYSQIMHSFAGFLLKFSYSILILLMFSKILQQTIYCISLKQNLNYEPILFFQTIQNQYFKTNSQSKQDLLLNFDSNSTQMMQQLPTKFALFNSFIRQISSSNHSLCEYANQSNNNNLYSQCLSKANLFNSGIASLISYVQDKLRRVSTGQFQTSYLQTNSDFTLAFKIFFTVFQIRNKLFSQTFSLYIEQNQQFFKIIIIVLFFIFLLCFYFSAKQNQQSKSNSQKIKSLFEIIPPFMREKFQQNMLTKQQNS